LLKLLNNKNVHYQEYIRMERYGGNVGSGLCGIDMFGTFPVVRRA
jgi:hypothetical protein